MDYEAVAERVSIVSSIRLEQSLIFNQLGCTGGAIKHRLAKFRKEIRRRNDPRPPARPQKMTNPTLWTNRSSSTEAPAEPNESTAHHGFPNATQTEDALFIKSEIAKLEASLAGDYEHRPWSKEEEMCSSGV